MVLILSQDRAVAVPNLNSCLPHICFFIDLLPNICDDNLNMKTRNFLQQGMLENSSSKQELKHNCELVAVRYLQLNGIIRTVLVMKKYRCVDCNKYFVRRHLKYSLNKTISTDWIKVKPTSDRFIFKGNRFVKKVQAKKLERQYTELAY